VRRYSAGGDALEVTSALGRRRQTGSSGSPAAPQSLWARPAPRRPAAFAVFADEAWIRIPKPGTPSRQAWSWLLSGIDLRSGGAQVADRVRALPSPLHARGSMSEVVRHAAGTGFCKRKANKCGQWHRPSKSDLRLAKRRGCPPRACSRLVVQTTHKLSSRRRAVPTSPQKEMSDSNKRVSTEAGAVQGLDSAD
jgi:hypothetical protein